MVWHTAPTVEAAADFESGVMAATFAGGVRAVHGCAPIACGDRRSMMRRGLSRRCRLGEPNRERVLRCYTVMRTCIPSARVIRMSVEKVGLPPGARAL